MHFHVDQALAGESSRALSGSRVLTYPTPRPAFVCVDDAIGAVAAAAFDHWGAAAELHVRLALAIEVSRGRHHRPAGAVTGWADASAAGAVWSVTACTCLDGDLAQVFGTGV